VVRWIGWTIFVAMVYNFSCIFNLQSTIQFSNSQLTLVHTFSVHHTICVNNNMDCMYFFVMFVFSGCNLRLNQYCKWLQHSHGCCACVLGPMSESNPRPCLICIIYKQVDYMLYFPLFFYNTKSKAQVIESIVSLPMLGVFNPLLGHRFHELPNIGFCTHKLEA
jgi:hypothetical protein